MNEYKEGDKEKLAKVISKSRVVSAVLQSDENQDLSSFVTPLKKAYVNLLNTLKNEPEVNNTLLKYFENNMNVINQIVANEMDNFQSNTLWNLMVNRYFVHSP